MRVNALLALLVVAASGCVTPDRIDQAKFDGVYRAGQALKGAVGVGVQLPRYRELLGTFAGEVAIAADKAKTPTETAMTADFSGALDDYKDAATIWNVKIQRGSDILAGDTEVAPLVAKHSLSVFTPNPKYPNYRTISIDDSIQQIWRHADIQIASANTIYNGAPR